MDAVRDSPARLRCATVTAMTDATGAAVLASVTRLESAFADFGQRLRRVDLRTRTLIETLGAIMATLQEVEALVDETGKDVTRLIAVLADAQVNLPPEAQAIVDRIAAKLGVTDAAVEAAAPEPTPEP